MPGYLQSAWAEMGAAWVVSYLNEHFASGHRLGPVQLAMISLAPCLPLQSLGLSMEVGAGAEVS